MIMFSIRQGAVPDQWKLSRVAPISKTPMPRNIETDIRPISVTSARAKITESFVCRDFNDNFDYFLDENQFGSTKGRSTTHAVIKLCHIISEASDSSENFVRLLFIGFSKAFDLINHNILHQKLID